MEKPIEINLISIESMSGSRMHPDSREKVITFQLSIISDNNLLEKYYDKQITLDILKEFIETRK